MLLIRNLTKTYGVRIGRVVFRGVDFALSPGEFVAIVGESGVGKSTFLNLIAGLDRPDGGTIELGGANLADLADDALTRLRRTTMGFVFQAFHVLPYLTIAENVALPLRLLNRPRRRAVTDVEEMLAAVGLGDRAASMPGELSGGELQRVALARALVHRPQLILADEPTGNLDSENGARVMALLREQSRARQGAVILVTHSAQAAAHADRTLELTPTGLIARAP